MNLNLRWRVILVLASVLLSFWILWPTIRLNRMSPDQRAHVDPAELDRLKAQALRLGLDLQGGMHLVLELDDSKLAPDADRKDVLDRALEIVRNRIDQFGVTEPVVQASGDKRIIVELAGIDDLARAQEIVSKAAVLEFKMVRPGAEVRRLVERMDLELARRAGVTQTDPTAALADTTDEADETAADTADTAATGEAAEVAAGTPATDEAAAEASPGVLPDWALADIRTSGGRPLASRVQLVPRQGRVAMNEVSLVAESEYSRVASYLDWLEANTNVVPGDVEWHWDAETAGDASTGGVIRYLYLLNSRAELTGEVLEDARPQPDATSNIAGNFMVQFELDRNGRRLFSRTTGENVGKLMAIVLDGRVKSAPEIHEKIRGGSASISGQFTAQEAADLAVVLRAGALPVPLTIEEQRAVGPSLGRDSIELGSRAILYGFFAVLIFMMIYYRVAGGIAVFALFLNLLLMLAALVSIDAVLTLPGIAGFALTVGMSVDANVLIYERLREEMRQGQTFRNAIGRAYSRVFLTIFDSNVTTLFAAMALLWFGTGPVKGFAVTLSLGIVVSMFTALFVTRLIFDLLMRRAGVREIPV